MQSAAFQKKNHFLLVTPLTRADTGKTYASAFALRDKNPKKALFLVHREQIAKQAIRSYKNVLGNAKTFGLLSGTAKDYEPEYLFSTLQMMAKQETVERFSRDEFDTIIIDEVHSAGSESYKRIMEYFTPNFWLGMTVSPDRTMVMIYMNCLIIILHMKYVCSSNLVLNEHKAAKWLTKDTLYSVDWLPADISLIDKIKEVIG